MPYVITKLKNNKYQVKNPITGKIHAKATTLQNAQKQIKLMHILDHINRRY